jgi:hypothetical protein
VDVWLLFTLDVVTLMAPFLEVRSLFVEAGAEPCGVTRFNDRQEPAGTDVRLLGIADVVMVVVGFSRSEVRLSGGIASPAEVSALGAPAEPPG